MFVPKSEIFLNFMFTRINEFLSAEKIEKTLDKLFGCSDWRVIKEQSNSREQDIVTLYRRQLKKFQSLCIIIVCHFQIAIGHITIYSI